jgi:dihydropteroate synthase
VQEQGQDMARSRKIATEAAHVAAVMAGAHLLRVHDIQAAKETAAVADALLLHGAEGRQ